MFRFIIPLKDLLGGVGEGAGLAGEGVSSVALAIFAHENKNESGIFMS